MSDYLDIFSFSVDSRKELAELKIVPSHSQPSICAQVHQLKDDSYWIFWNEGLKPKEYYFSCIKFAKMNGLKEGFIKLDTLESEQQARFKSFIERLVPVKKIQLSDDDMDIVWRLINHDFGPSVKLNNNGEYGKRFLFKIFGDTVKSYETWHKIPDKWEPLILFVDMVIKRIDIENYLKNFYKPLNENASIQEEYELMGIAPWMLKKGDQFL